MSVLGVRHDGKFICANCAHVRWGDAVYKRNDFGADEQRMCRVEDTDTVPETGLVCSVCHLTVVEPTTYAIEMDIFLCPKCKIYFGCESAVTDGSGVLCPKCGQMLPTTGDNYAADCIEVDVLARGYGICTQCLEPVFFDGKVPEEIVCASCAQQAKGDDK